MRRWWRPVRPSRQRRRRSARRVAAAQRPHWQSPAGWMDTRRRPHRARFCRLARLHSRLVVHRSPAAPVPPRPSVDGWQPAWIARTRTGDYSACWDAELPAPPGPRKPRWRLYRLGSDTRAWRRLRELLDAESQMRRFLFWLFQLPGDRKYRTRRGANGAPSRQHSTPDRATWWASRSPDSRRCGGTRRVIVRTVAPQERVQEAYGDEVRRK